MTAKSKISIPMPESPKYNPRQMMEKAIEVMRRSVGESRDDGKPNPLVGAVLVRPNAFIGTDAHARKAEQRDFVTHLQTLKAPIRYCLLRLTADRPDLLAIIKQESKVRALSSTSKMVQC